MASSRDPAAARRAAGGRRRLRDRYAWWEYALMGGVVLLVVAGIVVLVRLVTSEDSSTPTPAASAGATSVLCTAEEWTDPVTGDCVPRLTCAQAEVYDEETNTCRSAAPALASVSPRSGRASGGTVLTIVGSNFAPGAQVTIGGVPGVETTVVGPTTIVTRTPVGTSFDAVDVQVTNPDGQSDLLDNVFTYDRPPKRIISEIVPPTGSSQGGEAVLIKGVDFKPGAVASFNGRPATEIEVLAPDTIRAVIPAGPLGLVSVNVRNPGEDAYTLEDAFTYVDQEPRTITAVRPVEGPAAGGTPITIRGTGFARGAQVSIGGTDAVKVKVVDSTRITAVTPPGVVGPANVAVRNPDVPAMIRTDGFTYVEAPVLTAVDPATGPAAGGTKVTLTGTGFLDGAEVTVGGLPATDVRVVDDVTIRIVVPPAAEPGRVPITVTNPDQPAATLKKAFEYVADETVEPTPSASPTRPTTLPRCRAIQAPPRAVSPGATLVLTDVDLFRGASLRSPTLVDAALASGAGAVDWQSRPPRIQWRSDPAGGSATITYAYESPSCRGIGSGSITVSAQ